MDQDKKLEEIELVLSKMIDDIAKRPVEDSAKTDECSKRSFQQEFASMKEFEKAEGYQQALYNELRSDKTPQQCNDDIVYRKNTIELNGKPFRYKVFESELNCGTSFQKATTVEESIANLAKLNEILLQDIAVAIGGLGRITQLAVVSGMLIINGVQYRPLCTDKDFLSCLPFDCAEYVRCGLLSDIFDFGNLKSMPNLTSLKLDSIQFAAGKFACDIGIRGKFSISSVFKTLKQLQFFELGAVCYQSPGKEVNEDIEVDIDRQSRCMEIYEGFVLKNMDSFTNWTFQNLKMYACNRRNKKLSSYLFGTVGLGVLTVAAGVTDLGLHAGGQVLKQGFQLLRTAFKET